MTFSALRKLSTFRLQLQRQGLARTSRVLLSRLFISGLSKIYGFPPSWHNPTAARPYRLAIAQAVDALEPNSVCEVGCGLGSILARLHAKQLIGYDADERVIRAARLVRSKRMSFHVGSTADVIERELDVLIMVNWIHEIPPERLADMLLPLLKRANYLVVDAIDVGLSGYSYYHDFSFLDGHATEFRRFRVPEEDRTFLVYRVNA